MSQSHHVGTVLRVWREHRGWTLRRLAAAVPIDAGHLSRVERGYANVSLSTARTLDMLLDTHGSLVQATPGRHENQGHPLQLPGVRDELHGRDDLLTSPADWPRNVLLTGPPGVGTTTLAVHAAHQVSEHCPDGTVFADLHGFSPRPPREPHAVLGDWLTSLGLAPPQQPEARIGLWRSVTATRRLLVVVDNPRDSDHVGPLLPGGTSSRLLVAARRRLTTLAVNTGAPNVFVPPLSPEASMRLLRAALPASTPPPDAALHLLTDACAGLPQVLQLAAEHLSRMPHQHALRMATEFAAHPWTLGGDTAVSFGDSLDWSLTRLSPSARRVAGVLAQHAEPVTLSDVAAVIGAEAATAAAARDELIGLHLATRLPTGLALSNALVAAYLRSSRRRDRAAAPSVAAMV